MRAKSGADSPVMPPIQNRRLLPGGLYASRTSSLRDADRSDDLQSKDNSSKQERDQEHEWVEEEAEPGIYVTIRCSPTGSREIKRVKFRYLHLQSFILFTVFSRDSFLLNFHFTCLLQFL
jgi:hypothetical protein